MNKNPNQMGLRDYYYYFSVIDIVAVPTESKTPSNYWKVLKKRQKKKMNVWRWLQFVTN